MAPPLNLIICPFTQCIIDAETYALIRTVRNSSHTACTDVLFFF